jgi:thiamine-monophosphate kinase
MNEFELIRRYFAACTSSREDVVVGIGDDCALLNPPSAQLLAVTTDMLIAGRHFPLDASAFDIGWKSLAVNLSDLAAMGAQPCWFTLALSLPEPDQSWLGEFAEGLGRCAKEFGIALVGGDTTRGALSISITAMGTTDSATSMRRDGARAGDVICVTGTLGDAALGLRLWQRRSFCRELVNTDLELLWGRLHRPQPRVSAGRALRGLAHAAIDLSDGLAGDLQHILSASGVGAEIRVDQLPMSPAFARATPEADRLALQVSGGDDYELCICIPPKELDSIRSSLDIPLVEIGHITTEPGLRWLDGQGRPLPVTAGGYDHFQ